jgi:hypothetical protein
MMVIMLLVVAVAVTVTVTEEVAVFEEWAYKIHVVHDRVHDRLL